LRDGKLVAYHFGPSVDEVGGIGSVISTLVELQLGADVVRAVPTWRPDSHQRSAVLMARAILVLACLPRATVVHVHMSEGGSFVREAAVLATARLRGMQRIVTLHGYRFADTCARWPRLVTAVLGMATAITALSETDRSLAMRLVPEVPVELLPNPVALDRAAGAVSETAEVVLFAGEVGSRKGADVLCAAWRTVAVNRPLARCIVVGPATGLELPPLERLARFGPLPRARVRELIREARVVTLPSRGEVLPMILAEAMAAGRPFVATPVGGVESLAQGGLLVGVGDAPALAAALEGLLADPDRAQAIGRAGAARCEDWMAPEVVGARLRELYSTPRQYRPYAGRAGPLS
jgi:glycosyltransferase involved in cell wall biosynthesis